MSKAPPDTIVTLYVRHWEGDPPIEGDMLCTSTGRCYLIEFVRMRQNGDRTTGHFRCRVLPDNSVKLGDPGVFPWTWIKREKKR